MAELSGAKVDPNTLSERAQPFGPTRESNVSMPFVYELALAVELAEVPRSQLFSCAQFDAEWLRAPGARVPRSKLYDLCNCALDITRDPALGLRWAERGWAASFVPISHLFTHAGCLRQALESLSKFERLISDEPYFQLLETAEEVVVRCLRLPGESSTTQRFWAEMSMANLFRLMEPYDVGAQRARLHFAHAAPPHHREYTRIFGRAVRFEQPFTELVFDRALMDAPSPHHDAEAHDAMRALAERQLLMLVERVPFPLRVRAFLVQHGWAQRLEMDTVARSLGLSVRSLRRHLASEGKSYRAVESEALAIVAKHLLRDGQRTIEDVAYYMGFSDVRAFYRAFKRWTGTTPNAHRTQQLRE